LTLLGPLSSSDPAKTWWALEGWIPAGCLRSRQRSLRHCQHCSCCRRERAVRQTTLWWKYFCCPADSFETVLSALYAFAYLLY
jgi:hypothetical protein